MWKLKHSKKDHVEQFLFVGEDFIVGRRDSTLLLTEDPSVSRQHAVLNVKHPEANLTNASKKSSLFIRDSRSKYGTFKNGIRISSETEEQLNDGDIIKFGQFDSEFRVCFNSLVVTTSCLELSTKQALCKSIHALGGCMISEWQPVCTHLVMSEVKVTIKAVCCLVSAKPIVTPEYFQHLRQSLKSSLFTTTKNYIPPVNEPLIDNSKVSFDVNQQRKSLFAERIFYFLEEKQFKKLHLGIQLGGGKALILNEDNYDSEAVCKNGTCIIEPMSLLASQDKESPFLQEIISLLEKSNLRMIPESDIGLSVAYCSTDIYCNPNFKTGEVFRSQRTFLVSQTMSQREVYVPDTQNQSIRSERVHRKAFPSEISSLQLSSLHPEPVEEVPLSATLKRELDNIFVDLDKSPERIKTPLLEEQPPSSPKVIKFSPKHSPSPPPVVRTAKRQRTNQNKKDIMEIESFEEPTVEKVKTEPEIDLKPNVIPKRDIMNQTVNNVFENGHFPSAESDLPRNLMKIEYAALIYRKPTPVPVSETNHARKNFKKFRKVHSKNAQILPRIIGAHELVPYDKIASSVANDMWDEPVEAIVIPSKGEFDWDTPSA